MLSRKFGSNATWFQLNILMYNPLSALKRLPVPEELQIARPEQLRAPLFNRVGTMISHARRTRGRERSAPPAFAGCVFSARRVTGTGAGL